MNLLGESDDNLMTRQEFESLLFGNDLETDNRDLRSTGSGSDCDPLDFEMSMIRYSQIVKKKVVLHGNFMKMIGDESDELTVEELESLLLCQETGTDEKLNGIQSGLSQELPNDVMEEVFAWLPPESLRQFKLVKKSWYYHIKLLTKDPGFVSKHFQNMNRRTSSTSDVFFSYLIAREVEDEEKEEMAVKGFRERKNRGRILALANEDKKGIETIPCSSPDLLRLTRYLGHCDFKLVGHFDGIVCLADLQPGNGTIYLVNPSIKQMKIILSSCRGDEDSELWGMGFGYNPRSRDYRVVAFIALLDDSAGDFKVEEYSLATNSWSEISCNLELNGFELDHDQVYCNGKCFWYYWDYGLQMFTYDFSAQIFQELVLPPRMKIKRGPFIDLACWTMMVLWRGSVTFLIFPEQVPMILDIWVLNTQATETEGSEYWKKELTIGPLKDIRRPLGFWTDVEVLLETRGGSIKLYNIVTKKITDVADTDWQGDHRFIIYKKSFVSVL